MRLHRNRHSEGSLTDLPMSPDEDRERRFRMYFYMMLVRVACFGVFFIVPGWWKVIPAIGAVVIPYFAVVIANVSTHPGSQGIVAPNALPPGPSATPAPRPASPPEPERDVL